MQFLNMFYTWTIFVELASFVEWNWSVELVSSKHFDEFQQFRPLKHNWTNSGFWYLKNIAGNFGSCPLAAPMPLRQVILHREG